MNQATTATATTKPEPTAEQLATAKIWVWTINICLLLFVFYVGSSIYNAPQPIDQSQIEDCRWEIKRALKDPSSMTVEGTNGGVRTSFADKDIVYVYYHAKNSVGGMVPGNAVCTFAKDTRNMTKIVRNVKARA